MNLPINKVICGDCLEVMKTMDENSIDTIITDPPYGLSFMGKKWDYDVPSIDIWQAALRVLKPGGTALIFAGSRTQHRMACNVEDAGFILKDCIIWLYGSGFPKATDISKQLDKGHERKVIGKFDVGYKDKERSTLQPKDGWNKNSMKGEFNITEPFTSEAKLWNGWKSHGLKPAYEPILVAMKPNGETDLDILQAVVYTLNKNGFNNIIWNKKPVNNVEKLRTLNSSIKTKLQKTEGIFVENAKNSEMQSQEEKTGQEYLQDKEKNINQIHKNSELHKQDIGETSESKYSKSMEENVSVVEKHTKSSLPLTTLTEKESNTGIELEKQKSMQTYEKEDSQRTIIDSCATTAITLLDVTDIALTIIFENKEYIIDILSDGSLVYPNNLSKYRKGCSYTYAQNALTHGVSGLNIDGARVGTETMKFQKASSLGNDLNMEGGKAQDDYMGQDTQGRFPANIILDEEAGEMLGDPARFFYCPKASKSERNAGCEGLTDKNSHCTVKPIKLMEYLCTLTKTPTGGVVLDPFAGSGTTGLACQNTGRDYILIEREKEYCDIINARLTIF